VFYYANGDRLHIRPTSDFRQRATLKGDKMTQTTFSPNGHKRAVLYARVSSDDSKKDGRNLASQLDMGREYSVDRSGL